MYSVLYTHQHTLLLFLMETTQLIYTFMDSFNQIYTPVVQMGNIGQYVMV